MDQDLNTAKTLRQQAGGMIRSTRNWMAGKIGTGEVPPDAMDSVAQGVEQPAPATLRAPAQPAAAQPTAAEPAPLAPDAAVQRIVPPPEGAAAASQATPDIQRAPTLRGVSSVGPTQYAPPAGPAGQGTLRPQGGFGAPPAPPSVWRGPAQGELDLGPPDGRPAPPFEAAPASPIRVGNMSAEAAEHYAELKAPAAPAAPAGGRTGVLPNMVGTRGEWNQWGSDVAKGAAKAYGKVARVAGPVAKVVNKVALKPAAPLLGAYETVQGLRQGDMKRAGWGAADTAAGAALYSPAAPLAGTYLAIRGGYEAGQALPLEAQDAIGSVVNSGVRGVGKLFGQQWGVSDADEMNYLRQRAAAAAHASKPAAPAAQAELPRWTGGVLPAQTLAQLRAGAAAGNADARDALAAYERAGLKQPGNAGGAAAQPGAPGAQPVEGAVGLIEGTRQMMEVPSPDGSYTKVPLAVYQQGLAAGNPMAAVDAYRGNQVQGQLDAENPQRQLARKTDAEIATAQASAAHSRAMLEITLRDKQHDNDLADLKAKEDSVKHISDYLGTTLTQDDGKGGQRPDVGRVGEAAQMIRDEVGVRIKELKQAFPPGSPGYEEARAKVRKLETQGVGAWQDDDLQDLVSKYKIMERARAQHGPYTPGGADFVKGPLSGYALDEEATKLHGSKLIGSDNVILKNGTRIRRNDLRYTEPGNFLMPNWGKSTDLDFEAGLRGK